MEEIMPIRSIFNFARLPTECLRCKRMGSYQINNICGPCYQEIPRIKNSCIRCGTAMPESVLDCGRCITNHNQLNQSLIACPYISPLDRWIPELKDQRNFRSAPALQQLVSERLCSAAPLDIDLVLPMPIHWTRRCRRGYNQCETLAKPLAKKFNLILRCDILKRSRRVHSQRGLNISERSRNQKESFYISKKSAECLKGRKILLVEDIVTTGATVAEATKTLQAAGAKSVTLVAVARTPETRAQIQI